MHLSKFFGSLFLTGLLLTNQAQSNDIEAKLRSARQSERSQNWTEAINQYRSVLNDSITLIDAWKGIWRASAKKELSDLLKDPSKIKDQFLFQMAQGEIYQKYFRWERAISHFSQASQLRPDDWPAAKSLALAFLEAGKPQSAISVCQTISKRVDHDLNLHVQIAGFLQQHGLFDQAIAEYDYIATRHSKFEGLNYVDFGDCYERIAELDKAAETYKKGLQEKLDKNCLNRLIDLYRKRHDYNNAILFVSDFGDDWKLLETHLRFNHYDMAYRFLNDKIKKEPQQIKYYRWLAALYIGKDKIDQAEQVIIDGIDRNPDNKNEFLPELGDLFFRKSSYSKAADYYDQIETKNPILYRKILNAYLENEQTDKAVSLAEKLVKDKLFSYGQAGEIFDQAGKYNEAEKFYTQGLQSTANDFALRAGQIEALEKSTRYRDAIKEIVNTLDSNIAFITHNNNEAVILLHQLGNSEAAITYAKKWLLSLESQKIAEENNWQPFMQIALLRNQIEAAVQILTIVAEAHPSQYLLFQRLAEIMESTGQYQKAAYYYQQAHENKPNNVQLKYRAAYMFWQSGDKQRSLNYMKQYDLQGQMAKLHAYYQSKLLYETGKYWEALVLMNKTLPIEFWNPENVEMIYVHELRASILEAMGLYGEAEAVLRENARLFPDDSKALLNLAQYLFKRGKYNEAENTYRQIQETLGTQTKYTRQIAECNIFQNKADAAFKLLADQTQSDKNSRATSLHQQGNLAQYMLDFGKAVQFYQDELKLEPDNKWALLSSGFALVKLGKYEEALKFYEQAVQIDSNYYRYEDLGEVYRLLHQYSQAIKYYQLQKKQEPNNLSLFYKEALCYQALGETKKIDELIHALQNLPESVDRFINEGKIYEKTEQLDKTENSFFQAHLLKPGDLDVIIQIADLYAKMGLPLKAEVWYQRYFNFAPQHPHFIDRLASFYTDIQEYDLAESWFREAMTNQPWYFGAKGNLALNYISQGRGREAVELLKSVTAEHTEASVYSRALANAYTLNNENELAQKVYSQLLQEQPCTTANYLEYIKFLIFEKKDFVTAKTVLAQVKKYIPFDPAVYEHELVINSIEGNTQESMDQLIELLIRYHERNYKAQAQLYLSLAVVSEQKKEYLLSLEYLRKARQLNPNDFWIQQIYKRQYVISKETTFDLSDDETETLTVKQFELEKSINPITTQIDAQFVRSPEIIVTSPFDGAEIGAETVDIRGILPKALNPVQLTINGKPAKRLGMTDGLDPSSSNTILPFHFPQFPLVPGVNYLTLNVKFANGIEVTKTLKLRRVSQAISTVKRTSSGLQPAEKWAVVIGINQFEDTSLPVWSANQANAQAFAQYLLTSGGGNVPAEHIRLMNNMNLSRLNIEAAFKDFLTPNTNERDVVIFYYAGGAATGKSSDDSFYLLPADLLKDDLEETAIPAQTIANCLKRIAAQKIVFVLKLTLTEQKNGMLSDPVNFSERQKTIEQFVTTLERLSSKKILLVNEPEMLKTVLAH